MTDVTLLVPDAVLTEPASTALHDGWAVAVKAGEIAAVGPVDDLLTAYPAAERLHLTGQIVLPGLINAHQHGRGLTPLQLGFLDGPLERWINARRARAAPESAAFTELAAANMLANGVTAAVHANYSYGTGDYEAEVRGQIAAYAKAGLRVTFCVGAQDRGLVVYPPFGLDDLGDLPVEARRFAERVRLPYAADTRALLALMDRLLADWGDHPLVTLCWGPAGPQWVSDALFAELVAHGRANGLGLHLHCLESPVQAAVCRKLYSEGTLAHLARLGGLGPATVLAHGVHLNDEDIAVAAGEGVTVAHNPGSNLRLANGIAPVARLLAAGVAVALGTDNTSLADDEDLLGELRLMAGLARDPRQDGAAPDAAALIAAVTTSGARAMQQPDRLGRVTPGLPADLVAIDQAALAGAYLDADIDPLTAITARARGRDVRLTMVAGHVRYRDGRHPHLDRSAIEASCRAAAERARLPADPAMPAIVAALDRALERLYGDLDQPPAEKAGR